MHALRALPILLCLPVLCACGSGEPSETPGTDPVEQDSVGGMVTGTTGAPGPGTAGTPGTPGATDPDTIDGM